MAGLADLAAGMRLAGGVVSPGVFKTITAEDEQRRELAQRMAMFQQQQALQRERLAVENASRQDARADRLTQFREGLVAKQAELQQRHADRMALLAASNASAAERAAANQQFQRELVNLRMQGQQDLARLAASLRPERAPEPLVEIADPTSPTGRRYAKRSQAAGMAAPAPSSSNPEKPLTSSDLQKWLDPEGNHPPAGTTLKDLQSPASPYKVMTASQLAMRDKFKSAQASIDQMNTLVDKIWDPNDTEDGAQARIRNLARYERDRLTQRDGGEVAQYEAFSKGTIAALVRAAGEVGNLNEWEQQRALKMIPAKGDTAPVARAKMANLESWLYNASKGAIGVPSFASEAAAEEAAKAGKIKSGDRIRVGGKRGVWK